MTADRTGPGEERPHRPRHRITHPTVRRLIPLLAAVAVGLASGLVLGPSGPRDATPTIQPQAPITVPSAPADSTPVVGVEPDRTSHSRAGAVSAAAGYATILARIFPLDAARARSVVADAASDDARVDMVAAVDAKLVPLQQQAAGMGGATTYRQAVLAVRVESVTETRAAVYVWTLLTVTQTPQPGESYSADEEANAIGSFARVHLDLLWERGAWRIDNSTTLAGPTPLIDGTPDTGNQLNATLAGFTDWRPR
jgi:hypothetical protein